VRGLEAAHKHARPSPAAARQTAPQFKLAAVLLAEQFVDAGEEIARMLGGLMNGLENREH
jgi:hypothetical protein